MDFGFNFKAHSKLQLPFSLICEHFNLDEFFWDFTTEICKGYGNHTSGKKESAVFCLLTSKS